MISCQRRFSLYFESQPDALFCFLCASPSHPALPVLCWIIYIHIIRVWHPAEIEVLRFLLPRAPRTRATIHVKRLQSTDREFHNSASHKGATEAVGLTFGSFNSAPPNGLMLLHHALIRDLSCVMQAVPYTVLRIFVPRFILSSKMGMSNRC